MPEKNEKVKVSCTVLSGSAIPWTAACPAPLSMEFSRQEYWSGLPFPSPEDLPNPGIKPKSPTLQADSLPPEPQGKPTYMPSGNHTSRVCLGLLACSDL